MKKIVTITTFIMITIVLIIPAKIKAHSSESYIIMDQESSRIFEGKKINKIKSVASISKIMTAIVVLENTDVNKRVIIGKEIDKAYGSGIYIKKEEKIKIIDLLYGLMLRSGNDAAAALAFHTSGSIDKFVEKMNEKAQQLGMKNTTFNNPSGLDEEKGNYSTSYDMAILTNYAMQNKLYKKIVSTKKHKITTNLNTYIWYNKNKLLNTYPFTTGGKTGYTTNAKRTLVTTSSKNNLNLVIVTLNDGNDFLNHKEGYEKIHNDYKQYTIIKKGELNILKENYYQNKLIYIKKDIKYPLSEIEKNQITIKFKIEKKHFKNNMKIGKVKIYLNKKIIKEENIYVKNKKIKKSNFQKIKEWFK